jgi:hypothetical protein
MLQCKHGQLGQVNGHIQLLNRLPDAPIMQSCRLQQ